MPPITGQTGFWTPDAFAAQPDAGARLFWDLISLFYEVEAPTNAPINVEHTYVAQEETGAASYRFDDLPQRIVDKSLPPNYDLGQIAGVVRLGGGTGNDSVEINAHAAGGTNVTLKKQVLELADYSFDVTALVDDLPSGATHEDVQAALARANKETDIGVLDKLANREIQETVVHLSVDETKLTYTLREPLNALADAVDNLQESLHSNVDDGCDFCVYRSRAEDFVLRGKQLLGDEVVSVAQFSLDALDVLLNETVFRKMIEDGNGEISSAATDVQAALEGLRDYLTLAAVTNDLVGNGYQWTGDTSLRVYRQNVPTLSNREAVYAYRQEIWRDSTYNEAAVWNQGSGVYSGRLNPLDPDYEYVEELRANDLDNQRGTRSLREIRYTLDGTEYVVDDPSLVGNKIEMEKAYLAALDNLDTSYYTYSYYGVAEDGSPVLESVAIRRLNDTDPDVDAPVAGKIALDSGVYLTEDIWSDYLVALEQALILSTADRVAYETNGFSDETVTALIQTAFNQTLRDDVTAPIMDGLLIEHTDGNVDSINIQSLQDDAGFYLPKEVSVNRSTDDTVTVSADYVLGRQVGTEYTVTYDIVAGLNGHGLWLSGFKTLDLKLDGREGDSADDTVNVQSTHHLKSLTVNTGDGDDTVDVQFTAAETAIDTGPGVDLVTIQSIGGETTVRGGSGKDKITVNHFAVGADLTIDGQGGGDDVTVKLAGHGSSLINVFDTGGDGMDSLTIDGGQWTNALEGSLTDGEDDDGGLLYIADSVAGATFSFKKIQTIETLTLDLSSHNDLFTLDNSLADVNVTVNGNDGDDHLTVKHIGGETKFEGGAGADTLTVDFGASAPSPVGDLTFNTETLIVDNSSNLSPVAWQVTSGSVRTSDQQDDVLLINDGTHVAAELRILAGEHSGSTLEVTGADGPVTIDGGTLVNDYNNRIELVQGSTTVLSYVDSAQVTAPWMAGPKLIADDGAGYDYFGFSVAISGDLAIVGASGDDDEGEDVGSAYIFRREGASWVQEAKLTASDGAAGDNFGYSAVAISGDLAIVGAYADDDKGAASGSAYVFRREGASWVQEYKLLPDDGASGDFFGKSVAIFGDRAIVGAPEDDDKGEGSGSVYVFRREGASWVQEYKLLAEDGAEWDVFGSSVAISADAAIVGAG